MCTCICIVVNERQVRSVQDTGMSYTYSVLCTVCVRDAHKSVCAMCMSISITLYVYVYVLLMVQAEVEEVRQEYEEAQQAELAQKQRYSVHVYTCMYTLYYFMCIIHVYIHVHVRIHTYMYIVYATHYSICLLTRKSPQVAFA